MDQNNKDNNEIDLSKEFKDSETTDKFSSPYKREVRKDFKNLFV